MLPSADTAALPGFATAMAAITARIAAARDEAEALRHLRDCVAAVGADAAAFVSFVKDDDTHDAFRFLLACDPVWCAEYEQRAWYASDPWLAYAREHTEPALARDIEVKSLQQREIVALAGAFGFQDALIVPAPASGHVSRLGVLCLGSAQTSFFDADTFPLLRALSRALAMELHGWWIERLKTELLSTARLTDEDLLLLRHERSGLCTKAIAGMVDLSANAINSRFQRMNARLGVPNRKAAAQLAAEYGLI